ncbi:hypothetical protein JP0072_08120 [Helicobacter pylori]|nr:hypothetical protein JP0072_08120 [Helicobacter pylori]
MLFISKCPWQKKTQQNLKRELEDLNKALPFIGFAFEAWDSWNKYQKEQKLEEAKKDGIPF